MGENEKRFGIIALSGIIGILFAIVLQILKESVSGISTLFSTSGSLTLPEVQVIVIVVWVIFGIIIAAMEA
jgi:hypothetical protein